MFVNGTSKNSPAVATRIRLHQEQFISLHHIVFHGDKTLKYVSKIHLLQMKKTFNYLILSSSRVQTDPSQGPK